MWAFRRIRNSRSKSTGAKAAKEHCHGLPMIRYSWVGLSKTKPSAASPRNEKYIATIANILLAQCALLGHGNLLPQTISTKENMFARVVDIRPGQLAVVRHGHNTANLQCSKSLEWTCEACKKKDTQLPPCSKCSIRPKIPPYKTIP